MSNKMSKKYNRFPWATIVIGIAFSTALLITSCKPKEIDLSFETIEQKEWAGTGQSYEAREPGLIVISSLQDIANLDKLVTGETMTKLREFDYDNYFALVVFQGWKQTTGYKATINRVTRLENTVNIYAQFQEPKPDEPVGGGVTSPYHLVQVQKTGEWNQDITFQLIINETTVASLSHFTP